MTDIPIYHCHCTNVTQQRVLQAMAQGHRDIEAVRRITGACSGCCSCYGDLEGLIELVEAGKVALPAQV